MMKFSTLSKYLLIFLAFNKQLHRQIASYSANKLANAMRLCFIFAAGVCRSGTFYRADTFARHKTSAQCSSSDIHGVFVSRSVTSLFYYAKFFTIYSGVLAFRHVICYTLCVNLLYFVAEVIICSKCTAASAENLYTARQIVRIAVHV